MNQRINHAKEEYMKAIMEAVASDSLSDDTKRELLQSAVVSIMSIARAAGIRVG